MQGDPGRLKQLTLILLDNAVKYTPADDVVLEVQDTGIGISEPDLPRVFERFYRADPARRRDEGGSGLGLSIARWIAQQHGGEIKLSSETGGGTQVLVTLPLASEPTRLEVPPSQFCRTTRTGRARLPREVWHHALSLDIVASARLSVCLSQSGSEGFAL